MATPPTSTAVRPGRQRSELADAAILGATLDQLAAHGYAGFTVAAVIEQSGVSSATLYRRWTTKADLVLAALGTLVPEVIDTDSGSLAGDLAHVVDLLATSILLRREDVAEALNVEKRSNPELASLIRERFLEPRLRTLHSVLRRAKERGEVGKVPPTDVVLSLLVGPLHYRASNLGQPLTPAFKHIVVGNVVRGLAR
jgi:AcrR family transcriptional regulator